jgi:selenocysteine lyase/cysteine desulfurase
MSFDVSLARGQFPSLKKDMILMDNGGGTQAPFQVADALRNYMLENNVQLGGTYETSVNAAKAVRQGREVAAALLGVDAKEIIFGANMSNLLRNLALALSELWDPDDEIIVCQGEHEANFGCWEYLEQFGIKIRVWEVDPNSMTFDVSALVELMNDKTRLIAVHHSSNLLGNVMPLEEVSRLTRNSDVYLCVDGGQYIPHRLPDVTSFDADFYVFSGYKVFGPHIGVLYGKMSVLEEIPGWNHFYVDNDQIPAKFELGTGKIYSP